jgi:DNA-binding LacI/PurR family transcriptional regulator
MARGALTALRAAGIRVPDDVALVGFDDSSVAISTDPPLTTMRQPMYAQGEAMAGVLLSRLAGSDPTHTTILPTELVVRASS